MLSVCPPGGLFATRSEFTNLQVPGWPFCYPLLCVKQVVGLRLKSFLVFPKCLNKPDKIERVFMVLRWEQENILIQTKQSNAARTYMDSVITHSFYVTTNSNDGNVLTCCYDGCCIVSLSADQWPPWVRSQSQNVCTSLHVRVFDLSPKIMSCPRSSELWFSPDCQKKITKCKWCNSQQSAFLGFLVVYFLFWILFTTCSLCPGL